MINLLKSIWQSFILFWKLFFHKENYKMTDLRFLVKDKHGHAWSANLHKLDKNGNTLLIIPNVLFNLTCVHTSYGLILKEEWYFKFIDPEFQNILPYEEKWYVEKAFYQALIADKSIEGKYDYTTKEFVPKDLTRLKGQVDVKSFL